MNAGGDILIGVDVGGTSVKAVAVTPAGDELAREHLAFDAEQHMAFAEAAKESVRRLEERVRSTARAVGLSAPGLAARDGRSIAYMPGRFSGLVGLDWGTYLGRGGVPVLNDAQAALMGEVWLGAARGARDVILLTLGTGVGGAIMVDGRVIRGHVGKAGHLGHVSLNPDGPLDITNIPGSLEDAIGNHNILHRTGGRFATTHDLIRAHQQGDTAATEVWLRSVKALAAAIASFTNVLDPEVVIVGGGIALCGDALFQPLREWVRRFEWRVLDHEVRVVPALLGEVAGAFGAARMAMMTLGDSDSGSGLPGGSTAA